MDTAVVQIHGGPIYIPEKPPLGVMPKDIWKSKRVNELLRSAYEYHSQGNNGPIIDWLYEALDLLEGA